MNKSSTWTALRNPAFRRLWIATVISGTCVAAHDGAATWMMNIFTGSPFLISLSQGAMAVGGVIWGSAAAIAGPSYTQLGAAVLFLASLLLAPRLSINIAENIEERVSGALSNRAEPEEVTQISLTRELLAA